MSDFQERLWSELVREHVAVLSYPTAARNRLRPLPILEPALPLTRGWGPARGKRLLWVLAALLVTLVVASTITDNEATTSAAYAVTENADGTISVSIDELTGVSGANAQLAKLGAPARVVPVQAGCPQPEGGVATPPSLSGVVAHIQGQGIAIDPSAIPAGDVLVLAAKQVGTEVWLGDRLYRGAAPPCIAPGESYGD